MERRKYAKKATAKKKKNTINFIPSEQDLVFIPLGGTDEVGMNMALIGHDQEWILIDCGITFHDTLGMEILTADPTFIVQQKNRLKGLFITHAHEDHIGAVEYLWPLLQCPIYAAPFAAEVLRQKLQEKSWSENLPLVEIPIKQQTQVGKFSVEPFFITHSIPEAMGYIIRTPLGTLVHTGDWTLDTTPVLGPKVDEKLLKHVGDEGVLAYFSDSTNIFMKKDASSEKRVRECMKELVQKNDTKRITVACFSSNIARIETALLAAESTGRKVAVVGRSLKRMIAAAKETGVLTNLPKFIDEKTAASSPPGKVLLICTGSQGEERSALVKIASGEHPLLKMGTQDLVLFSSRVIPGNDKSIGKLHSLLARANVDIITSSEEDIHASGHPSRDTVQKMYELLRPKIVIPVHGEARHLIAQAHFAREHGIKHVIPPLNGAVVQLAGDKPGLVGRVPSGKWAVDGKRMVAFEGHVVKQRTHLSEEGSVFATILFGKDAISEVILRLIGLMEPGNLYENLKKQIIDALHEWSHFSEDLQEHKENSDAAAQRIVQTVYSKIGKRPVVEVHWVKI
ncbi:MBL fold hydrolase [Alphaproteobacteria bacterium]|nr:MBL fold hydrolase [Alphaproteobacteria bacterium]GHS97297.1 MBL fold hydrolase [Alphaproteobacteria bacterium]